MSSLLLTQPERDRFAAYLEHEAATSRGIIEHLEKIGAPDVIIKKLCAEATASLIVAAKLRSMQTETL